MPICGGAPIMAAPRSPMPAGETIDGAAIDHLVVTPQQRQTFDAWFDAQDAPAGAHRRGAPVLPHQRLLRGLSPGARRVAAAQDRPGRRHRQRTTRPTRCRAHGRCRATAAPTRFRQRRRAASPSTAATASVTVPFQLLNNHIYVQGTVEWQRALHLHRRHRRPHPRLAARRPGCGPEVRGRGGRSRCRQENVAVSGFAHVDEIAIGAVRLRDQTGFARRSTTVDRGHRGRRHGRLRVVPPLRHAHRLRRADDHLHRSGALRPGRRRAAIPFVFYDHLPLVDGAVGDLPARFDIDTGSRSEVDLTGAFREGA